VGSASAETAVALPALLVFAAALIWGIGVAATQARCESAARSAALAIARGEAEPAVAARVRRLAGATAAFAAVRDGREVRVTLTARAAALGLLPARTLTAHAVAEMEPAAAPR
jgi:hypothetical protein